MGPAKVDEVGPEERREGALDSLVVQQRTERRVLVDERHDVGPKASRSLQYARPARWAAPRVGFSDTGIRVCDRTLRGFGQSISSPCATVHPLHTRFDQIFGGSISEVTMRPDPNREIICIAGEKCKLAPLSRLTACCRRAARRCCHPGAAVGRPARRPIPRRRPR